MGHFVVKTQRVGQKWTGLPIEGFYYNEKKKNRVKGGCTTNYRQRIGMHGIFVSFRANQESRDMNQCIIINRQRIGKKWAGLPNIGRIPVQVELIHI